MTYEFDEQIAVDAQGGEGFKADLSEGWVVGNGVNGGYLLAVIGNAIRASLPAKPDPLAVSAYYLATSHPGPATIETRVLREGGSVATVAADLVQDDRTTITTISARSPTTSAPRRRSRSSRRPTSACPTRWRRRRCARSPS